jgi:hypothetical protein
MLNNEILFDRHVRAARALLLERVCVCVSIYIYTYTHVLYYTLGVESYSTPSTQTNSQVRTNQPATGSANAQPITPTFGPLPGIHTHPTNPSRTLYQFHFPRLYRAATATRFARAGGTTSGTAARVSDGCCAGGSPTATPFRLPAPWSEASLEIKAARVEATIVCRREASAEGGGGFPVWGETERKQR